MKNLDQQFTQGHYRSQPEVNFHRTYRFKELSNERGLSISEVMTIAFCAVRRESPRADPGERQAEPAGVPQVPLRRQPVGLRLRRPQDCPGTKAITLVIVYKGQHSV